MVSRKEFMKEQLRLLTSLETKMDSLNEKRKESINLSKLNKKELRKQVKLEENLNTRTKILTMTQKLNNDQFNFGIKTFQDYRKAGGTTLEYLSAFMTGTSEKVKILGFEAQAVRRVIYGFMPPGMFRIVNKVASVFNGLGSSFRAIRDGAKGSNNMLTSTVKLMGKLNPLTGNKAEKGLLSVFGGKSKELKEIEETLKGDERNVKLLGKIGLDPQTRTDLEARRDELQGQQSKGFKDNIKGRLKSLPEMGIMSKFFKKTFDVVVNLNENALDYFDESVKFGARIKDMGKMAFRPMMTFLIMAVFYLAIFSAIVIVISKTIKEAWQFMSEHIQPFIYMMLDALSGIWESAKELWQGIMTGDLLMIIDGVLGIVKNILQFVIGLALTIVSGLLLLAIGIVKTGLTKVIEFVKKGPTHIINSMKDNIGKVLLAIFILTGLFVGWPLALAGLAVVVVGKVIKGLYDAITPFAAGGTTKQGLSLVGEKGPELVRLPTGSRVHSNRESRKMVSSNNSGGNTINITINAKDTSDAEMRRIAEKVGRLVNNSINRNTGMSGIR